jgi:peptidoglycan pentaglycine glycine transferase (the first glycine)
VIQDTDYFKIGAQILIRRIVPGINLAYIAKGPVYDFRLNSYPPDWSAFWQEVDRVCRAHRAFFLKVEPDIWVKSENFGEQPPDATNLRICSPEVVEAFSPPEGFSASYHSIQPPRTLIIDIRGSEEQILARMKQKTRYNIRLAMKRGVVVKSSNDLELFSRMMNITGNRDDFNVHDFQYYRTAYDIFNPRNACQLFFAEHQAEMLAAIMVFFYGKRAWYLYGASSDEKRELMPTYILQWEAIRWAKKYGCLEYDLWGVPDEDLENLELDFANRKDGLWGVYRFKRGFGGELRRSAGPWDRIYNPILYKLFKLGLEFVSAPRKHKDEAE